MGGRITNGLTRGSLLALDCRPATSDSAWGALRALRGRHLLDTLAADPRSAISVAAMWNGPYGSLRSDDRFFRQYTSWAQALTRLSVMVLMLPTLPGWREPG